MAFWLRHAAAGAEIQVFAAASLTDALKSVGAEYQKTCADHVTFNFAGSSTLARQIEEGAPADLFFSADEAKMDALEKQGLIVENTRKSRLSNCLVVVVPADSSLSVPSAGALTNASFRRIALADPRVVPAGIYSRIWLEELGLWSGLKPKIIPTENVRGALAAVESGNVDAGIVYRTDAAITKRVKVALVVPQEQGPRISYPVALVKSSKNRAAAKGFLEYVESAQAGRVYEKFGFIVLQ